MQRPTLTVPVSELTGFGSNFITAVTHSQYECSQGAAGVEKEDHLTKASEWETHWNQTLTYSSFL